MTTETREAILISRRDADRPLEPSQALLAARESGELPRISLQNPQYGLFEMYAITRYDEVREVLGDPRTAMGMRQTPGSLAAQPGFFLYFDGDQHARLRRMLSGAFSVKAIESLRPTVERIVEEHLDALEQRPGSAELVRDFALPVPSQVICELLGVPYDEREGFLRWSSVIASLDSSPEDTLNAIASLHDYIAGLLARLRVDPCGSLLDRLIAEHGDKVSDEELVGIGMVTLIAGHETTANAIALGTLALLEHPDQLQLVRDDPTVTRQAIEEILRYLSVATPPNRLVVEEMTVGCHTIPAGERVMVSLLAANSDPALVGDTPGLDVRRTPLPSLTFGHGVHQCIGQHLARLELTIAIPGLVRRFPALKARASLSELSFRQNAPIYGVKELPVSW